MLIQIIANFDRPTENTYSRGGDWLLKFLDEYNLMGLMQATTEQLHEFINKYHLDNKVQHNNRSDEK